MGQVLQHYFTLSNTHSQSTSLQISLVYAVQGVLELQVFMFKSLNK